MSSTVLFVTALGWEAQTILRHLPASRQQRIDRLTLWRASRGNWDVWVLKGGIGPESTRNAIRWAAEFARPNAIVSAGCAGALSPDVGVGDLVVGAEVCTAGGSAHHSSPEWVNRYREAAIAAGVTARLGRLLTSPVVIATAEDKQRAGRETESLAVEMEGAVVAEWARESGVEFVAARAILDSVSMTLPDMTRLVGPGGRPRLGRLLLTILRHPPILSSFMALRAAMQQCQASLLAVHAELLSRIARER